MCELTPEQTRELTDAMVAFCLRVMQGGEGCTAQETAAMPLVLHFLSMRIEDS